MIKGIPAHRALALLFLCCGCGGSGVELGDVGGRITMEGEPLAGALVQFIPEGGGRSAQGRTNDDGEYHAAYSVHETGAKVGRAKVMITTGSLEDPQHRNESVDFSYNYESDVFVDIEPGVNTFDFDVKRR